VTAIIFLHAVSVHIAHESFHREESICAYITDCFYHANLRAGIGGGRILYQYFRFCQKLYQQGQAPVALQRKVPDDEETKGGREKAARPVIP
jgi:hypothetical protein